MRMDSDLVTTQKAAILLGLSPDHARLVLRKQGLKPVERIGAAYLWDEDEVNAIREQREAAK
jgi:hypothetical protein